MVVSNNTAERMYEVFKKHLTAKQMRLIFDEMAQIPGNQSFRETVGRLLYIHSIRASTSPTKAVQKEDGTK